MAGEEPVGERVVAVTPKGQAIRHAYRLVTALGVLPGDDRAAMLDLLTEEAAELPPVA